MGITVEQLRAKYPEPQRTPKGMAPVGTYCVGGALAREVGMHAISCTCPGTGRTSGRVSTGGKAHTLGCEAEEMGVFPEAALLARAIQMGNPLLTPTRALAFARLITRKNDTGNFETAWGLLADALAWTDESWTPADDEELATWAEVSA